MNYINYQIHLILNSKYKIIINLIILSLIYLTLNGNKLALCLPEFADATNLTIGGYIPGPISQPQTYTNLNELQQYFRISDINSYNEYSSSALKNWHMFCKKYYIDLDRQIEDHIRQHNLNPNIPPFARTTAPIYIQTYDHIRTLTPGDNPQVFNTVYPQIELILQARNISYEPINR